MGRPPAVVIVARHGARLDAADTQWHLTSPTPYDPPLTYGGWKQSQSLGARIASIIQHREILSEDQRAAPEPSLRAAYQPQRGRRRRQKIVIHSSPFLRCIQTSIAISAGLDNQIGHTKANAYHPHIKPHNLHSASPLLRAADSRNSPQLEAIAEPEVPSLDRSRDASPDNAKDSQTLLRVDAFLGEWLSPDYFDDITPPPASKMMVAGAKADLLRRGEPVDAAIVGSNASIKQGNFPGGWRSGSDGSQRITERSSMDDMSEMAQHLPRLGRASTFNYGRRTGLHHPSHLATSNAGDDGHYVAPMPSYAISPLQPIPQGYVTHARDLCVNVDYQWDSLRPPLEWGDGGEYGEEWSSMHKRFRRGLHHMLSWYRMHDPSHSPEDNSEEALPRPISRGAEDQSDDSVDTILIIVTHGAGCNALIGALTNQPVLIDVGMASLTMAVRKKIDYRRVSLPEAHTESTTRRQNSSLDAGDSEDYDVRIVASTDHLRPGSHFLNTSRRAQASPPPVRDKSPYRYERHVGLTHHASSPLQESSSPKLGGRKSSPSPSPAPTVEHDTAAPSSPGGLWSRPAPKASIKTKSPARIITALPEETAPTTSRDNPPAAGNITTSRHQSLDTRDLPKSSLDPNTNAGSGSPDGRPFTHKGLWGAAPLALAAEREKGSKRRWTLSQA